MRSPPSSFQPPSSYGSGAPLISSYVSTVMRSCGRPVNWMYETGSRMIIHSSVSDSASNQRGFASGCSSRSSYEQEMRRSHQSAFGIELIRKSLATYKSSCGTIAG
jgi:hypothetical protein